MPSNDNINVNKKVAESPLTQIFFHNALVQDIIDENGKELLNDLLQNLQLFLEALNYSVYERLGYQP